MPVSVDIAPPQTTTDTEYVVATNTELERPYRVIIENDDVTPMDFVVLVLLTIFELAYERAEEVMYQAHLKGRAYVAERYSPEERAAASADLEGDFLTLRKPLLARMIARIGASTEARRRQVRPQAKNGKRR